MSENVMKSRGKSGQVLESLGKSENVTKSQGKSGQVLESLGKYGKSGKCESQCVGPKQLNNLYILSFILEVQNRFGKW